MAIQADVAKRAEVRGLFATIEKDFGRLDILVNNVGMFFAAKFDDLTEEQWDTILDTNLKNRNFCARKRPHRCSAPAATGELLISLLSEEFSRGRLIRIIASRRRA